MQTKRATQNRRSDDLDTFVAPEASQIHEKRPLYTKGDLYKRPSDNLNTYNIPKYAAKYVKKHVCKINKPHKNGKIALQTPRTCRLSTF